VNYDADNHEGMVKLRAAKIQGVAKDIPPLAVEGPSEGDLLVLSWGGTFGAVATAVRAVQKQGGKVAHAHLRYMFPFQANLGEVLSRYKKVLIPELNCGQLRLLIRGIYLVDAVGLNKIQGKPFVVTEIVAKIQSMLQ